MEYVTKEQLEAYRTFANLSMKIGVSLARLDRRQVILVSAYSLLSEERKQDKFIADTFASYLEESKEIVRKMQRDLAFASEKLGLNDEQNRNS